MPYRFALAAMALWLGSVAPAHAASSFLASSDLYSADQYWGVCFVYNASGKDVTLAGNAVQAKAGTAQANVAPFDPGTFDTCNGKILAAETGCHVWFKCQNCAGLTCKVTLPVLLGAAQSGFRASFMLEDANHNPLLRDDLR